jgi:hypothetical protein
MTLPHKAQPDGFSIWHDRHGKRWCWRQIAKVDESRSLGHVLQRTGLLTRPKALADLHEELERRKRLAVARAEDQTTTALRGGT